MWGEVLVSGLQLRGSDQLQGCAERVDREPAGQFTVPLLRDPTIERRDFGLSRRNAVPMVSAAARRSRTQTSLHRGRVPGLDHLSPCPDSHL